MSERCTHGTHLSVLCQDCLVERAERAEAERDVWKGRTERADESTRKEAARADRAEDERDESIRQRVELEDELQDYLAALRVIAEALTPLRRRSR